MPEVTQLLCASRGRHVTDRVYPSLCAHISKLEILGLRALVQFR